MCADFDGSESTGQGGESNIVPWVHEIRPLFSIPGPSFPAATAALKAYEQTVSAPGNAGDRQTTYTCTPWVSGVANPHGPPLEQTRPTAAPRIAVVTLSTSSLLDKAAVAMALEDKQEYCDRHGYDFVTITQTVDGRDAAWAKLPGILALLYQYDWVVSLDLDTIIYNHGVRLEEFLDPNHDMIVGLDYNGINSGVFFLRNTTWSRALLTEAWTITNEPMSSIWWEQSALMRLVKSEGVRNHIKYCPQVYFNSYIASDHAVNLQENDNRGPFIVHFAGIGTKWEILPRFHAQRVNVNMQKHKTARGGSIESQTRQSNVQTEHSS